MGRIAGLIALAAGALAVALTVVLVLALAGPGGGSTTPALAGPGGRGSTAPAIDPVAVYLARLNAEQAKLAAAERAIPANPRTPAEFSRSIGLLASAVGRLGGDLAAIDPPAFVAAEHRQLVSIVQGYAAGLRAAAGGSRTRAGELQAASRILSATSSASAAFSAIIARIHVTLKR
jgi:hypothetical protein